MSFKTNSPDANALLVKTDKTLVKITLDFSDLSYEMLGEPLGVDRVNIISTMEMRQLSARIDEVVVGYCDANGYYSSKPNNHLMEELSGYDVIIGDCVLCGWDRDYAPLSAEALDRLVAHLKGSCGAK